MKRLAAIIVLICSARAFADDSLDAAVTRLKSVGVFAFGGVGFAGTISQGEIDFRLVLSQSQPDALNALEKLYVAANPQGKSYALAGIKRLDPVRFKEMLTAAEASKDAVFVMRGCIGSREPLRDIGRQIDHGMVIPALAGPRRL